MGRRRPPVRRLGHRCWTRRLVVAARIPSSSVMLGEFVWLASEQEAPAVTPAITGRDRTSHLKPKDTIRPARAAAWKPPRCRRDRGSAKRAYQT